jgi:hypothetical protein
MMGGIHDDYGLLLERFVRRKMPVDEFLAAYLKLFKSESRQPDR